MVAFGAATVVALATSAIGSGQGISSDEHGSKLARGPGDGDNENLDGSFRVFDCFDLNIVRGENVDARAVRVVDGVPEIPLEAFGMGEPNGLERPVGLLIDTKEYDAALGVRKSGIGFPDAFRQSALRALGFEAGMFAKMREVG